MGSLAGQGGLGMGKRGVQMYERRASEGRGLLGGNV
jgi:hypothetical protein